MWSKSGLFDEVVGRGWTLLSPSYDPAAQLGPEAAGFFKSVGGICAHVSRDGPVRDTFGAYEDWFAAAGVEVVLQRPDYCVFGTARCAESTGDLVDQLREGGRRAPSSSLRVRAGCALARRRAASCHWTLTVAELT